MMGTGWRKAFCTSARRDATDTAATSRSQSPSPRTYSRFRLFSSSSNSGGGSNPSTPRTLATTREEDVVPPNNGLRCRTARSTAADAGETAGGAKLQCGSASSGSPMPSPRPQAQSPANSNPCSPRSPSRFSLLRSTFRFSKNRCGICLQSVKAVQGTAIFIAECSHSFHFPCISTHVRKQQSLACPVCAATWRQVPLLPVHPLSGQGVAVPENDESRRGWTSAIAKQTAREITIAKAATSPKTSSETKGYSDDEPLLSPGGSASRFNPIPEAEEGEDGEEKSSDNEFQGFFSTSNISPPPPERRQRHHWQQQQAASTTEVQITVNTDVALLSSGRNHDKYVVALKVKALLASPTSISAVSCRAPIDLVMVLDVGGAMTGLKMQMLKRSVRQVILSLTSSDRLSVVAFAATSKRLLPLTRMTIRGQHSARRIVDRLVPGAGTGSAVGDALRKATRILEDRRERNPVASIMLISDGQQQQLSSEKPSSLSLSCRSSSTTSSAGTRFAHIEIPVIGATGYAEQETPEEAFARCIGGLLSVIVHDVNLHLTLASGEITTVYSIRGQPSATITPGGLVKLGDLYLDEERDLLVEVRIPTSGRQAAFKARCNYRDSASQEAVQCGEVLLPVVMPPMAAAGQRQRKAISEKAVRIRNLFVATRAVTEARRLTGLNDTGTALHLLSSARSLLMQSAAAVGSGDENLRAVEVELAEIQRRHHRRRDDGTADGMENGGGGGEALTPTSAWRAAEKLAKLAIARKSLNRVRDLHGFEDARF